MSGLTDTYDVIIIGGGAAGLMAAAIAGLRGKQVLILEKNAVLGKKLSITGGGRCNILNAETDVRTLLQHYGTAAKFLHSPFAIFGMPAAWDFFTTHGLPLVVEAGKRAFPSSHNAADVVQCFLGIINDAGVTVQCGLSVEDLEHTAGRIIGVKTNRGRYTANSYIIATGGLSHPETGSTGDGLTWLSSLGHTIVRPNPSLVPLLVSDPWVHRAAGVALSHAKITFALVDPEAEEKPIVATGKLLFTHFGLSGPAILNVAAKVQMLLTKGRVCAAIDVVPGRAVEELDADLMHVFFTHQNKALKNVLKHVVPVGMSTAVAGVLDRALLETPVHSVTREARQGLARRLKALPCTVTGTKGNDWAIVSDGGVPLTEIDTRTMRSHRYCNLHIIGDVLHISRPSGGYSLQLCWTTGAVAGSAA